MLIIWFFVSFNKTESPIFVLLCVLCLQRQPFRILFYAINRSWRDIVIVCRQQFTQKTSNKPVNGFWNNCTGIFLGWPSMKIAEIVPLRWTKRPPELKNNNNNNNNNNKNFKRHVLLGQWSDFKIISQKCFLGNLLPKLLKWFCSAELNGRQR